MTLAEYNERRARAKLYSLVLFFSFLGASLSAAGRNMPLAVMFGLGLIVSTGLLAVQVRRISRFRCPRCGKDPLTWVSSDAESATYDSLSISCLNCGFDLRS
jgi:predicted RNA-binding Zn-ribbon protein involved in translation (DUF1610 family)